MPEPAPLEPGVEVAVGFLRLSVNGLLGEGSFGAVWSAEVLGRPGSTSEVALKEIVCQSEVELHRATIEERLLEYVGASRGDISPPSAATSRRCPSLLASEVHDLGPDCWLVRMVMTRIAGEPLSKLLDACAGDISEDQQRQLGLSSAPVVGQVNAAMSLASASHCALTMLQQLAPALEHVSSVALHRDITPRNILLHTDGRDGHYSWGLVDFGLAVETSSWKSAYLDQDIGGDGHYWPTSAWFTLAYGAEYLANYPYLLDEYQHCLDMHALGISALRTLMELWSPRSQRGDADGEWAQLAKILRLRVAWSRYWEDVDRLWRPVFDACIAASPDALNELKSSYALAGIHNLISADLCAIRAACIQLRAVAVIPELRRLCDALVVLIRPGRPRDEPPAWAAVHAAMSPGAEANAIEFRRTVSAASEVFGDPWKGDLFHSNGTVESPTAGRSPSTRTSTPVGSSVFDAALLSPHPSARGVQLPLVNVV